MDSPSIQNGRPRRYTLCPVPGFANTSAAYAVAALDELLERLLDLISGLPPETLELVPEGGTNSIAMLTVHMAWAEATWISRVTQTDIPSDLRSRLLPGSKSSAGELPPYSSTSSQLIELCRRVRQEITYPRLRSLHSIDTEVPDPQRPMTVRGVLMHLIWHWTYHSGQVGLLRRLSGARYQWTFGQELGAPRST